MFTKLLKFILVTRFSKPFLLFIVFFTVYGTVLGLMFSARSFFSDLDYYATGLTCFVLAMSLLTGGLQILKSDLDYLLLLPIDRIELAGTLFISQFLASTGVFLFLLFGYTRPLTHNSTVDLGFLVFDLLLLGFLSTSLSVISHRLTLKWKAILAAMLGAYLLSAIFGFKFSPSSIFSGEFTTGTVSLAIVTATAGVIAFRELSRIELTVSRPLARLTSTTISRQQNFVTSSKKGAVYRHHFLLIEVSGRANLGGSSSFRSVSRVSIWKALLVTSALALAYYLITAKSGVGGNTATDVTLVLTSYMPSIFLSQGGIQNERLWLGFTAVEPWVYMRHLLIAKAFANFVLVMPFILANLLLYEQGTKSALSAAFASAYISPATTVLMGYTFARFSPIQVKDIGVSPAQFNLRQLASTIPSFFAVAFAGAALVSPYSNFVSLIILISACVYILVRKSVLEKLVYTMSQSGFI